MDRELLEIYALTFGLFMTYVLKSIVIFYILKHILQI